MKVISISVLRTSSVSIVFLLSPGITVEQVLDQLKVKDDYVLFPVSDPANLFDQKDELYDRVENGSRLIAACLPEALEAYRRSRAYTNPPNNIM
jgi:hypothetical protein